MGLLLNLSESKVKHTCQEKSVLVSIPRFRLLLAIILLVAIGTLLNLSPIDLQLASIFSDGELGFPYRLDYFFDIVLHLYAARVSAYIGSILILFNLAMCFRPMFEKRVIIAARYTMYTWACSVIVIAVLKDFTTLPCPWDLAQFGGDEVYVLMNDIFSSAFPIGNCFPSAHSTGGYGLLGLGFVFAIFGAPMVRGFSIATVIGLIYGGAQIVRGAHFLSHDFFTIAICLSVAWVWAELYLVKRNGLLQ
jgi:membrane-associated PAP2 superfamily phosphatase